MTRTQTLLLTTALAMTVPLVAMAQTATSGMKCGPVAFSARDMNYSSAPCTTETAGTVGTSGPTVFGGNNSSSMTKAEQKQGAAPYAGYAPVQPAQAVPMQQAQAVSMGPNMIPAADQCGPSNMASITDEYGRKYNCRGDRIR